MPTLHDIDIWGRNDENGNALEYFDQAAIKNALTFWLVSKKGEYINNPVEGGVLDFTLFKNMNEENLETIHFKIKNALINRFTPTLEITKIELAPNYEKRYLKINIDYINPIDLQQESISLYANVFDKETRLEYQEIEYTGNNLLNFVIIKKADNVEKKLVFDVQLNCWVYGDFKFVNFNTEDPYFEEILRICNEV